MTLFPFFMNFNLISQNKTKKICEQKLGTEEQNRETKKIDGKKAKEK